MADEREIDGNIKVLTEQITAIVPPELIVVLVMVDRKTGYIGCGSNGQKEVVRQALRELRKKLGGTNLIVVPH